MLLVETVMKISIFILTIDFQILVGEKSLGWQFHAVLQVLGSPSLLILGWRSVIAGKVWEMVNHTLAHDASV